MIFFCLLLGLLLNQGRVQNLLVDYDHLQDVLDDQDLAQDVLDDQDPAQDVLDNQDLVEDDLLLGQDLVQDAEGWLKVNHVMYKLSREWLGFFNHIITKCHFLTLTETHKPATIANTNGGDFSKE